MTSSFAETSLPERWQVIESHGCEIALALRQLGEDLPPVDRKVLDRLARWFAGHEGYEQAIQRPDVLAVCLPVWRTAREGKLTEADIQQSVRLAFLTLGRTFSTRGRYIQLLLYSAFVITAMAVTYVLFSYHVIPLYQSLFEELEMTPPVMSTYLFKFAWLIRAVWVQVLVGVLVLLIAAIVHNWLIRNRRMATESWLDNRFQSARNGAGGWAWHVATLLESGFEIAAAVTIAGDSQGRKWLQQESRNWLNHRNPELQIDALDLLQTELRPYVGFRYPLMDLALGVDNREAQIELFREIAAYYWAVSRTMNDWLIGWFVLILNCFCLFAIVLLVVALLGSMYSFSAYLTGSV